MDEMQARGYKPDPIWRNPNWRGSTIGEAEDWAQQEAVDALKQNVEANQMMAKASGGQSIKSAGDTSSDKQSTGKQADSLANPDKSKDNDAISGKNFTKE